MGEMRILIRVIRNSEKSSGSAVIDRRYSLPAVIRRFYRAFLPASSLL